MSSSSHSEKQDEKIPDIYSHVGVAASDADTGAQLVAGGVGDVDPAEALRIR